MRRSLPRRSEIPLPEPTPVDGDRPRDFPVPEGATPVYSLTAGDRVMTWFDSEQSLRDLKAFDAEALPRAGYTIDSRSDPRDSSGVWSVIEAIGRRWTGGVYIAAGGGNGCRCMECMVGVAATGFDEPYGFFVPLEPSD